MKFKGNLPTQKFYFENRHLTGCFPPWWLLFHITHAQNCSQFSSQLLFCFVHKKWGVFFRFLQVSGCFSTSKSARKSHKKNDPQHIWVVGPPTWHPRITIINGFLFISLQKGLLSGSQGRRTCRLCFETCLFWGATCLKRIICPDCFPFFEGLHTSNKSKAKTSAGELIEEQSMQTQTDAWARVVWVFGWV